MLWGLFACLFDCFSYNSTRRKNEDSNQNEKPFTLMGAIQNPRTQRGIFKAVVESVKYLV